MFHYPKQNEGCLAPLLFFFVLVRVIEANFIGMTVTSNNLEINQPAQYTFVLNRNYDPVNFAFIAAPTPVPLNSLILVTFPTQFLTVSTTTSVLCTDTAGNDLGCTLNSATRTVTASNYYSTSATLGDGLITIKMSNIVNAYISGPSSNFFWQINDPSGTTIDQGPPATSTTLSTSLNFVGGTFQSCAVTSSGNLVSTYRPFTFNLTPKNQIPSAGKLIISIPNSWASDPTSAPTFINNPTCTEISGIGSSNLACSYNSQTAQLTVTGLTQSISAAFSFQVSNILTPPTVGSGELISIFSQWSDGTAIDSCTSLITGLSAAPFQAISLVSNDNTTVQSTLTASLKVTISRAFNYQDTIVLTLPTEFQGLTITSPSFATITRTPNLNNLTLSNFPSIPATITSNNIITFNLANINNPLSTAPITLSVSFYRSNQLYQVDSVTYSATTATLTAFSISPNSNFVQAVGQATINLDSTLFFPTGSTITLTYPVSVTAGTLAASAVTRASLNGTIVTGTTFEVGSNQITIRNIFGSNFQGTVVVIIPTFVNPPTTQPSTYSVAVNDQNGFGVMTSSFTMTANTKALLSNSVAASSLTVLASGVTYTLSITTNFDFSSIAIGVPTDITIGTGFQNTCGPNNFSSCVLAGQTLTFTGTLPAGTYHLSWGLTTNPNSLQPSGSFSVTTYLQGHSVEHSQGVITVTMTNSASFTSFIVFPSVYNNSAVVSVTLNLVAPAGMPAGQLTAAFPTELGLSSASCSGCTVVPPNILFSLPSATTNFSLTVNNVQNVGSFKPISAFTASVANSNNYLSVQSTTPGWTNTQPSSFSSSVAGSNDYRGEANTFLFSLSGMSGAQSYVRVTINSAFPAVTTAPTGATLVDSHNLDYSCTSASCSLNIPLTNPTALGTYTFDLNSYSAGNFQVGTSVSNNWNYACVGTECRSCQSNGSCLTCYSSTISSFSIFNTQSSSCTSACAVGFFLVATTCTPCDANCTQCISASTNCTACASSYFLDLTYDICVPLCLPGQFANALNQQCNSCNAPCATCQLTADRCLSCQTATYLHGTSCLTSCPTGTHVANPSTLQCDPCSTNCLTCSGAITFCLTCNNSQPLYFENNVCVSACSTNYFINGNNICEYCNVPCRTCGSALTDCTSCFLNSSAPIYHKAHCISTSQCLNGNFINNTNSSCQACPTECSTCSSPTSCSICNTTFFLLGSSCLSTCPNTTYPFSNTTSGYCLPCNSCTTCTDASTCTSCPSGQFLYNGICYANCPSGSFSLGLICSPCDPNCPTCQNFTYCLTCVPNMLLYLSTCYSTCPSGTYPNTTSQSCIICTPTCATCTSPTNCQSCAATFSLENNFCVQTCAVGISVNQTCFPCGLNCAICNSSTGTCSSCSASYFLYNNTCLTACPADQLSNDGITCVPCTTNFVNCSTCSNTQCLSCTYGQLTNGTCVPCTPGTYDLSGTCVTCSSVCTTCTSQTSCQSCATGYYLLVDVCTATCPTNMIPNGTICSPCLTFCSVCNLTNSMCSVCNVNYFLLNNLCFSQCPAPLVTSFDALTCVTQQVFYQQFSEASKIIPFPFTIAAISIVIIGVILKCFHPQMHLQTLLCSIVSLVQLPAWIVFLGFEFIYYQNYHETARMGFLTGCITVGLLVVFNFIHLRFFYKYINPDEEYNKWQRHFGCTNCVILSLASALTFKFYRLIHSKFLGRAELSLILSSPNKLIPFSLLGVLALFLCSAPICVGCALALYNSVARDQEFFIALDTLVVTGIMALLILMDLRHSDDYFIDQHETKNLKRKIYEEDEYKFSNLSVGQSESGSEGQIQHIEQVEGEAHLPSSGQKFTSTFQQTKRISQNSEAKLQAHAEEEDFEFEDEEGEEAEREKGMQSEKGRWQPIEHDHHGYIIKRDAFNDPVLYDEYGNKVEIDEDGNHKRTNKDGNQVRIIDGKPVAFDSDGYMLVDGKPYDERGYEVRQEEGEKVFYDEHGFKVIGHPPDEKHVDEEGNTVIVDEDGTVHRYNEGGYEIVDYKGQKLLKNEEGQFVRKNKDGQYEMYDPEDGFTVKRNPQTGQLEKFDELGFRIEKDEFGNIKRYDQDGFIVTVLPGGLIVKHDKDGYRVEKDQEGNIHRFDEEGYELIEDENGVRFIDKNGYRVERDLYGRVALFDEEGLLVVVDPETGKERRFNEEGLQAEKDVNGKRIWLDKRGKEVREEEGGQSFEKFDREGNKIYLNQDGYEVEYDEEGNVVLYDKVGDRVDSDYEIEESDAGDNFESMLVGESKRKPSKYKYKPTNAVDNEVELDKLMTVHQPFTFEDEEEELSELQDFHHQEPPVILVDHQIQKLVAKERGELQVGEVSQGELDDLVDFEREEELDNVKEAEPEGLEGLAEQGGLTSQILPEKQNQGHNEYDKEAVIRGLDEKEPQQYQGPNGQILTDPAAIKEARRIELARILAIPRDQEQIEIKSVADVAINERSFENEGVQPLDNKTEYDQLDSIGELEVPLGRTRRAQGKKTAQTVYNYNTVDVEIKNNQNRLYDEEEEIESLHEDEWEEQHPVFTRDRVKEGSSNANTNILYVEQQSENKDALSDFVQHQSETKSKPKIAPRYPAKNELFSGKSIEQIEEQLFEEADNHKLRERKQFKLSGAPNPLVEYAKAMDANRKSLQEKMYLDSTYKK